MKKSSTSNIAPKIKKLTVLWLSITTLSLSSLSLAQPQKTAQPTFDREMQNQVVEQIAAQLTQGYVFPDKAKVIANELQALHNANQLKSIADASEYAEKLTQQLQALSHDKHLMVEFNPQPLALEPDPDAKEKERQFELSMWRAHNFGFEKIERLPFNIGYFQLSAFGPTQEVGPLLAATMNLLTHTDSLIIDLRGNFGGEEQTVSLLASYFFEKRTHLLDMYKRKSNTTEQHWSFDYVEGKKYATDKDVYILIDNNTLSAGEDFSYTMKHFKRATLIGETTGGAANSGDFVQLTPHFSMFLPSGRGISPITKTNWEGVGVTPDVSVAPDSALSKAQQLILKKLLAIEKDERRKKRIKARMSIL